LCSPLRTAPAAHRTRYIVDQKAAAAVPVSATALPPAPARVSSEVWRAIRNSSVIIVERVTSARARSGPRRKPAWSGIARRPPRADAGRRLERGHHDDCKCMGAGFDFSSAADLESHPCPAINYVEQMRSQLQARAQIASASAPSRRGAVGICGRQPRVQQLTLAGTSVDDRTRADIWETRYPITVDGLDNLPTEIGLDKYASHRLAMRSSSSLHRKRVTGDDRNGTQFRASLIHLVPRGDTWRKLDILMIRS